MSFSAHARNQAEACVTLGSPFTARLLRLAADRLAPGLAIAEKLRNWPAERLADDAVALRFAGALHFLVLTGANPDLAALYRDPPADDAQFWTVIAAALRVHEATLLPMLEHAPQTNEVARSAVLIATAHWLSARYGLPLVLSELGASAGLNLLFDHYALDAGGQRLGPAAPVLTLAPDWQGAGLPASMPVIRDRAGVDLNPLDPVADRQRMLAYIWADQSARRARSEAALDLAARLRPPVAKGCAVDWLAHRLANPAPKALHLVYHTVVWQYLPPDLRQRGADVLAEAGARALTDSPLAHLAMEQDGQGPGAGLCLHLWPGDEVIDLGRADFHGRWVEWRAPEA